jgi:hypothetical protein
MRTTCGRSRSASPIASSPFDASPEPRPDERLVVDDQHADEAVVLLRLGLRLRRGEQPVDANGPLEVLEVLLSEVDEQKRCAFVLLVLEERPRRLREQDLAAGAGRADPRGAVDRDAVVLAVDDPSLARVDADAHPDGHALGPLVTGERALHGERGQGRVLRPPEHDEERVPVRPDPLSACRLERRAQQPVMVAEDVAPAVPEAAGKERRALDIAEEKGERPARLRRHRPTKPYTCGPGAEVR